MPKDKTKTEYNNKWEANRTSIKRAEFSVIIFVSIIVLFGIISDIAVSNNVVWVPVENFESYILSLLGIQATIATLTIALVALISNNISESHMGVSVSDYYLNIRPAIFKQRVVICITLALVAMTCGSYIFGWYNVVISLSATTIIFVILSACEIYFLFRGSQITKNEIELYVSENIGKFSLSERYEKKKMQIIYNFINDWMYNVYTQPQSEYNQYKKIFLNSFESILKHYSAESLSLFKEISKKHICTCLDSDNDKVKARGIVLLNDIYDTVWRLIINKEIPNGHVNDFRFFDEVYYSLIEAFKEMSLNILQKSFNWEHFTDIVSRISFHLIQDDTERTFSYDLSSILQMSSYIGYIIKEKENDASEKFNNLLSYWGRNLSRPYLDSAYNIPEKQQENYLKFKCKNYFYYCKGFIDNEYTDIVKENIFYRAISNSYYSVSNMETLYYLSINCYLYYLSEKESKSCVDENIQAAARNLLEDKDVISLNDFLLSKIDRSVLEYTELEEDLQNMLSKCEWFPKFSDGKTLIMENVVREFYVFTQLLLNNSYRYYNHKLFELKEPSFVYINQFLQGAEENTKKNLKRFYSLFQHDTKNIDKDVDEMYSTLEEYLKSTYKEKEMIDASKEEQEYLETTNETAIIQEVQSKLKKHFDSIFGKLSIEKTKSTISWTSTFNLINYNLFTKMVNENIAENMYTDIDASLVTHILSELLHRQLLEDKTREQFENDIEFIEFLKQKKYKTLIGSEYIFKNIDYKNKAIFDKQFENMNCIFYGFYKYGGIALKANQFKINIKNVKVTIDSVSLDDIEYETDEQGETLSYRITNDIMVPFKRDELMVYIKNKRKMIKVSVDVELIANKKKIGSYITRTDI